MHTDKIQVKNDWNKKYLINYFDVDKWPPLFSTKDFNNSKDFYWTKKQPAIVSQLFQSVRSPNVVYLTLKDTLIKIILSTDSFTDTINFSIIIFPTNMSSIPPPTKKKVELQNEKKFTEEI